MIMDSEIVEAISRATQEVCSVRGDAGQVSVFENLEWRTGNVSSWPGWRFCISHPLTPEETLDKLTKFLKATAPIQ